MRSRPLYLLAGACCRAAASLALPGEGQTSSATTDRTRYCLSSGRRLDGSAGSAASLPVWTGSPLLFHWAFLPDEPVWLGCTGDIILLGLREFQDQKADIILKYDGDEARSLKTFGELPDSVQVQRVLASRGGERGENVQGVGTGGG